MNLLNVVNYRHEIYTTRPLRRWDSRSSVQALPAPFIAALNIRLARRQVVMMYAEDSERVRLFRYGTIQRIHHSSAIQHRQLFWQPRRHAPPENISLYKYFQLKHSHVEIQSPDLPLVELLVRTQGEGSSLVFIPMELCWLLPDSAIPSPLRYNNDGERVRELRRLYPCNS